MSKVRARDAIQDKAISIGKHSIRTTASVSKNVTINSFRASMHVKSKAINSVINQTTGVSSYYGSAESKYARQVIGRSTSLARFSYRMGKSGVNRFVLKGHYKRQFRKGNKRKAWRLMNEVERRDFKAHQKNVWKKMSRNEKRSYYEHKGLLPGMNKYDVGHSVKHSIKQNTRLVTSMIESQNDIAAKATVQGARYTKYSLKASKFGLKTSWKAGKLLLRPKQTLIKIGQMISSMISSIVSFVASIPGILMTLVSMLPVLIVLFAIIGVMSLFDDLEYTGRVTDFVHNETYLEYRYDISVHPDEVLAISDALNWSTNHKDDYEKLFAIMTQGKESDQMSFEEMLDNVFNTYNPARYTWGNETIRRAYSKNWIITSTYEWKDLSYDDYLDIYPDYNKLPLDQRSTYGSDEMVAKLKQDARDALTVNAHNYAGVYFITNSEDVILSNPVPLDAAVTMTDIVGHRHLTGSFHAGDDWAVPEGTPLLAVRDAEVISAMDDYDIVPSCLENFDASLCAPNGGGNQVTLRFTLPFRDGKDVYVFASYYHMQKGSLSVKVGDKVSVGDVLGKASTTGQSTGTHLHLQMWWSESPDLVLPNKDANSWDKNGRYLDPLMLMEDEYRNMIKGRN